MGKTSAATDPIGNEPQNTDSNDAVKREWIEAWKTVICAEVLSAFTRCEELVLDPLLMHF
jgi:hypothetical protein